MKQINFGSTTALAQFFSPEIADEVEALIEDLGLGLTGAYI